MSRSAHRGAALFAAKAVLVLGAAIAVSSNRAPASALDGVNVMGWYGEGVHQTALVLDFSTGDGAGDSFAFGWNFGATAEDTISVYDLMDSLRTATAQNPTGGIFNFTATDYTSDGWGYFLNSISYTSPASAYFTQNYRSGEDDPTAYWYVRTSSDGGVTWASPEVGISFISLSDGDIGGFVCAVPDEYVYWSSSAVPVMPASVPEPSTLLLAAMGLAAGAWQWRRCRGRAS